MTWSMWSCMMVFMEILDAFPETAHDNSGLKYPYDEWLDGQVRRLTRGVDFTVNTKSMRTGLTATARKRGGRLRSTISNDGTQVTIQYMVKATQE